jgi:hypothetical protein
MFGAGRNYVEMARVVVAVGSGPAYSSRHLREAIRITRRTAATVRLMMGVYHSIRGDPFNSSRAAQSR